MLPTVDVAIPCYGYGRFLRECVGSVLDQSGVAVRVLIIDDASTDDSAEIAADLSRGDPRVRLERHARNRGHIATYNEAIEWAGGQSFLLLSADDYLLPGALARAAGMLAEDAAMSFCFGNALMLTSDGSQTPIHPLPRAREARVLSGAKFIAISGASNIVPTPTAVVRTALQKAVGGYRPELHHSGDMEMWLRLAAHGSVGFVAADQAVYRRHGANMSVWSPRSVLPDLLQRQAAIEAFILNGKPELAENRALQQRLDRALGQEAIRLANVAFNSGQLELCEQILDFARQTDPGIERSLPFLKLSTKKALGLATWQRLASARRFVSNRQS